MKSILLCICLMLMISSFSHGSLYAQERELILPITKQDMRFLNYFFIKNEFDSAHVSTMVGEFTIRHPSGDKRIVLPDVSIEFIDGVRVPRESWPKTGMSGVGRDTLLSKYLVTESFTLPSSGASNITFYRELAGGKNDCNGYRDMTEDGGGEQGTGLYYSIPRAIYNVGVGNIADTSEFRIEVVRKSDNTLLYVLDSVGVRANPTYKRAMWYGTHPDKMYHVRSLPLSLAGEHVYLRIVPYRWGPTPLGMDANYYEANGCNLSYRYEY